MPFIQRTVIISLVFYSILTYISRLQFSIVTSFLLNFLFTISELCATSSTVMRYLKTSPSVNHNNKFNKKQHRNRKLTRLKTLLHFRLSNGQNELMLKKRLMQEFLLSTVYVIWVIAAPYSFQRGWGWKNLEQKVGLEHLVYYLPMIAAGSWKICALLKSRQYVEEHIDIIEDLIGLQCLGEIFAGIYLVALFSLNVCYYFSRDTSTSILLLYGFGHSFGCVMTIVGYLGIKYGWSLRMRITFWEVHLMLDRASKLLNLRKFYHLRIHYYLSKLVSGSRDATSRVLYYDSM